MSFAVLVRDVLAEKIETGDNLVEIAEAVQVTLLDTLKDDAVRREVYDHAMEHYDEMDMQIVHTVLDALVVVLGEVTADV